MVQSLYKSWVLVSNEFEQLQTSSGKSKKLKFDGLLSKRYIPSAKTLHTEDLSNINFNYLCENSPNYLCHFWNLNPIQDGHFRGSSRIGVDPSLPKICHTYPTMIKLGTIIPYLKKTQKIYESRDAPPDFCWH